MLLSKSQAFVKKSGRHRFFLQVQTKLYLDCDTLH